MLCVRMAEPWFSGILRKNPRSYTCRKIPSLVTTNFHFIIFAYALLRRSKSTYTELIGAKQKCSTEIIWLEVLLNK